MRPIVVTPAPILFQTAKPVNTYDEKLFSLVREMENILRTTSDPKGVGLAASQIGIPMRLFIMKPSDKAKITICVNPRITEEHNGVEGKKPTRKLLEGCLSIPRIWGKVARKRELTLEYQDEKGKLHKRKFRGFAATIIHHELDHLDGILFTKRVMEQGGTLYRSYKNEKGEDEFEEIKM